MSKCSSVVLLLLFISVHAATSTRTKKGGVALSTAKETFYHDEHDEATHLLVRFENPCRWDQPLCFCYDSPNADEFPRMIDASVCGGRSGYFCFGLFKKAPVVFADYLGTMKVGVEEARLPFEGGKTFVHNTPFYIPRFLPRAGKKEKIQKLWRGTTCEEGGVYVMRGLKRVEKTEDVSRNATA